MPLVVPTSPIAQHNPRFGNRTFCPKGFAAASTREIVEAAGSPKPMLYYYFQNKEGLYLARLGGILRLSTRKCVICFRKEFPPEFLIQVVWLHLDHCNMHRNCAPPLLFPLVWTGRGD